MDTGVHVSFQIRSLCFLYLIKKFVPTYHVFDPGQIMFPWFSVLQFYNPVGVGGRQVGGRERERGRNLSFSSDFMHSPILSCHLRENLLCSSD